MACGATLRLDTALVKNEETVAGWSGNGEEDGKGEKDGRAIVGMNATFRSAPG